MSRVALALVGALAFLAACYPATEPVPRQTDVLRPLRELTSTEVATLVSLPWTIRGSMTAGRQIGVTITGVRCFEVVGAHVEASPEALTVAVYGQKTDCGVAAGSGRGSATAVRGGRTHRARAGRHAGQWPMKRSGGDDQRRVRCRRPGWPGRW